MSQQVLSNIYSTESAWADIFSRKQDLNTTFIDHGPELVDIRSVPSFAKYERACQSNPELRARCVRGPISLPKASWKDLSKEYRRSLKKNLGNLLRLQLKRLMKHSITSIRGLFQEFPLFESQYV
jgi:hypothetical protein